MMQNASAESWILSGAAFLTIEIWFTAALLYKFPPRLVWRIHLDMWLFKMDRISERCEAYRQGRDWRSIK